MNEMILHYIYDPLCGWCYGAELMVRAASEGEFPIVLHGGGLWNNPITPDQETRRYVRENDSRIAQLTGQEFGGDYINGLLSDPETVFWSQPTIAAVLAAEGMLAGAGLAMLYAIQHAHYVLGRPVVYELELRRLAAGIDLNTNKFLRALKGAPVESHLSDTRLLMRRIGLRGYPSFVIERGNTFFEFPHEPFYGNPSGFVTALKKINHAPPSTNEIA